MIKNMDERVLAELEIKKLEELKQENCLTEVQMAKLEEWTSSIKKQISDFDDEWKNQSEEGEKEVGNEDAPFLSRKSEREESVQLAPSKHLQNRIDGWVPNIRITRPLQPDIGGKDYGIN